MKMVGVDVGGTFTDAVYFNDETGEMRWAKSSSTPLRPADGVVDVIERNSVHIADADRFVHGITIGTNTVLEKNGASVWMLVTRGFGDVLEIARTNRTQLYDIKTLKPTPIVPRHQVIEIDERLDADGSVIRPLNISEITDVAEKLTDQPAGALTVCFLHSYANSAHELLAVEILREVLSNWFICCSTEVLPEMREYERFNTTAINAYIGPVTKRYLEALTDEFCERGYKNSIYIMASSGGIMTAKRASCFPIQTVLSGPAGGVAAARHLGLLIGAPNLITYDMGGTSTDVCLIQELNVPMTSEQVIADNSIRTPQIEVATVGAGGGSIAWVDDGKILNVGPNSAGSLPGPASYNRGGIEFTVTDANLILGRLSPQVKLGGSVELHKDLAVKAVKNIVSEFPELDEKSASEGIIHIAGARMVTAIKQISVSQGYDPREFALLAYGGAGPMHAAAVAEAMEISHVIIPPGPGNFSAFGALISDMRQDRVKSRLIETKNATFDLIEELFSEMESDARISMKEEDVSEDDIYTHRTCGMRYLGQSWDLDVTVCPDYSSINDLTEGFYDAYKKRFGYLTESSVEIVSFRLSTFGRLDKPELPRWNIQGSLEDAETCVRTVFFNGRDTKTTVYSRERLPQNTQLVGPAIVEEMGSVTVIPPGWLVNIGVYGEIHLNWVEDVSK